MVAICSQVDKAVFSVIRYTRLKTRDCMKQHFCEILESSSKRRNLGRKNAFTRHEASEFCGYCHKRTYQVPTSG
jgi:hypothetical protein